MKNKKIIIVLIIVIILTIIALFFLNRKNYSLKLPSYENIVSLGLESFDNSKLISNKKTVKDVLDILNSIKKTNLQSKDMIPKDNIKIILYLKESVGAVLYTYKENNKYYIMQSDNGLYEISKEDYDKFVAILNE